MWYFVWIFGLFLVVGFVVLNVMWFEMDEDRCIICGEDLNLQWNKVQVDWKGCFELGGFFFCGVLVQVVDYWCVIDLQCWDQCQQVVQFQKCCSYLQFGLVEVGGYCYVCCL